MGVINSEGAIFAENVQARVTWFSNDIASKYASHFGADYFLKWSELYFC